VVTVLVLVLSSNLGLDYVGLKPGRLRACSILETNHGQASNSHSAKETVGKTVCS
jgi:hypothetical protein